MRIKSTVDSIKKEQSIADAVLERLEVIDPTCILAGGAPRDWWLGTTANDLDFYLTCRGTTYEYEKALSQLGFSVQPLRQKGYNVRARIDDLYGSMPGIVSVYEGKYRGKNIQIIRMAEPTFRGVVDKFAVSISKVWYKNGAIRVENEAQHSLSCGKILVAPGYTPESRYIKKMIERFPTFSFLFQLDCGLLKPEAPYYIGKFSY